MQGFCKQEKIYLNFHYECNKYNFTQKIMVEILLSLLFCFHLIWSSYKLLQHRFIMFHDPFLGILISNHTGAGNILQIKAFQCYLMQVIKSLEAGEWIPEAEFECTSSFPVCRVRHFSYNVLNDYTTQTRPSLKCI